MFSTYRDFAPFIILITISLVILVGRNAPRDNLKRADVILAIAGLIFGLVMTTFNLIYTSKDLFVLSPVIALSCILYLRYRNSFHIELNDSINIKNQNYSILSIFWWVLVASSLLSLYLSEIYTRQPLFFVIISSAVAVLGIQIITANENSPIRSVILVIKIIIISIILRYSAFFISSYPVGSDPWVHIGYINHFIEFGRIAVPVDFQAYYINYPLSHIFAASTVLLGSISTHQALFAIATVLTISTIFPSIIVKMLTGKVSLALLSMLILNFADSFIQWGIQVIAMSFGLALYSSIIYIIIKIMNEPENKNRYLPLLLVLFTVIVWTHTISTFITLTSMIGLLFGYIFIQLLCGKRFSPLASSGAKFILTSIVFTLLIMLYHWMDPSYPFIESITVGMANSVSHDAGFLGAENLSNVTGRWDEIMQPLGFCLFAIFGIIGSLYSMAKTESAKKYFPLILMVSVLFAVRYAFPIFGLNNIVPDRWPAFGYVLFSLFIGIGVVCIVNLQRNIKHVFLLVFVLIFAGSFLMITNASTNEDSPIIGKETVLQLIWKDSEMSLFSQINATCDGTIIADEHTISRPFRTYLGNQRGSPYQVRPDGDLNYELLSNGLVIWRRESLTRPEHIRTSKYVTQMLLGDPFYEYLNNNFNCISDVNSAKGYLSKMRE